MFTLSRPIKLVTWLYLWRLVKSCWSLLNRTNDMLNVLSVLRLSAVYQIHFPVFCYLIKIFIQNKWPYDNFYVSFALILLMSVKVISVVFLIKSQEVSEVRAGTVVSFASYRYISCCLYANTRENKCINCNFIYRRANVVKWIWCPDSIIVEQQTGFCSGKMLLANMWIWVLYRSVASDENECSTAQSRYPSLAFMAFIVYSQIYWRTLN